LAHDLRCRPTGGARGRALRPEGVDRRTDGISPTFLAMSASAAVSGRRPCWPVAVPAAVAAQPAQESSGQPSSSSPVKIGVALTYTTTRRSGPLTSTTRRQYAKQLHIQAPRAAALGGQCQPAEPAGEELVNEGAKAVIVNPENRDQPRPGHLLRGRPPCEADLGRHDRGRRQGVYSRPGPPTCSTGLDACAYISSFAKSGYVPRAGG